VAEAGRVVTIEGLTARVPGFMARRKRSLSPGRSWPIFHNSAPTIVTGQTKPPRLGPSGPSITGMSPVKSTLPIAYALS